MYYLRRESYEETIPAIVKTDGVVIPKRTYMTDDRAIYKHTRLNRFYRQTFRGVNKKCQDSLKLYQVKSLDKILQIRSDTFEYCKELFDVYDENGIVDISEFE